MAEQLVKNNKLSKRTLVAALMILLLIPATIWFGYSFLGDRKYYFIGLLIVLYTMIPFFMVFEGRKPQARELIIIAVLAAIAVAGRVAFFWLPQVKPVVAIVIIAAVCFGGEAGFLVGALTGFVSNFFFMQGPYTPWQMFCFGIIGFLAGVLCQKGWLKTNRLSLCIFGGVTTFFIYGAIMDFSSVLQATSHPTWGAYLTYLATGLPFNIIHGVSTVVFLFLISQPMIEKIERIKIKYGLIEQGTD